MAMIYATLIIKGKRKIENVPKVLRQQVIDILNDLELPELTK
ncbi:CD1375 family protein [Enterococcus sp. DIV1420a]